MQETDAGNGLLKTSISDQLEASTKSYFSFEVEPNPSYHCLGSRTMFISLRYQS